MAAATSTASSSGEAIEARPPPTARSARCPVSASSSGSAAVRMITRMVCTTAIAGDVGALLGGEHRDLRQRAGATGQQRRGRVPAVHALQIEAGAEGRAERRERQQADGQRIGAHVLDQLPRHQRAQRDAEQHQHGLRQDRRHARPAVRPARRCRRWPSRRKSARPAGSPQKQQAAGGADDERLERAENLGAVGNGGGHRGGDQAHAALWQIRHRAYKCVTRLQQCRTGRFRRPVRSGIGAERFACTRLAQTAGRAG